MSEDKNQIFTDKQKLELERIFSLIKERQMDTVNILEDMQMQQKNGAYNYSIEDKIDRLRSKIERS